jgi:hypothetical protein
VHLVYTHGSVNIIFLPPGTHPGCVLPGVRRVPHHGSGPGGYFRSSGKRISLFLYVPSSLDYVLVKRTFLYGRNKSFPNSGSVFPLPQRVALPVPEIEIPSHKNSFRSGSPEREKNPFFSLKNFLVGTELFPKVTVGALAKKEDVVLREKGRSIPYGLLKIFTHHKLTSSTVKVLKKRKSMPKKTTAVCSLKKRV